MVDPGLSSPARSAASTIVMAGRSLTLPPGLRISSLATSGQGRSRPPGRGAPSGVADEVEERVGNLHLRPAVGQRHDLDAGQVLALRHVLVGVQLRRQPRAAQLRGHRFGARAHDRDVPRNSRANLGDQRRGDLGERDRQDVVRPGGETLGRLVGSDYDEQSMATCWPTGARFAIEIVEFDLPEAARP